MTWTAVLGLLLKSRVGEAGWSWFERARAAAVSPVTTERLLVAYTGTPRKLGKGPLQLSDTERQQLLQLDTEINLSAWNVEDLARVVLLLSTAEASVDATEFADAASAC